ncbi:hypothetical protein JCM6882_000481 [Rhodosporidiobolus microsporus]
MPQLPNEVLDHILRLAVPEDFSSPSYRQRQDLLLAVCLASSRLCSVAQPILHEAVEAVDQHLVFPPYVSSSTPAQVAHKRLRSAAFLAAQVFPITPSLYFAPIEQQSLINQLDVYVALAYWPFIDNADNTTGAPLVLVDWPSGFSTDMLRDLLTHAAHIRLIVSTDPEGHKDATLLADEVDHLSYTLDNYFPPGEKSLVTRRIYLPTLCRPTRSQPEQLSAIASTFLVDCKARGITVDFEDVDVSDGAARVSPKFWRWAKEQKSEAEL